MKHPPRGTLALGARNRVHSAEASVTHDPAPQEVKWAISRLEVRARQSAYLKHQRWTQADREAVHVLLAFVALVTSQARRS